MLLTLITKSTNTSHSPKIHIPFSKMCFQDLQDLNPNLFKFCLLSVLTKYSTLYCLGKENILLFPKYAIFFLPYSWLCLFWSILFVNSACTQPLNHVWLCDPMAYSLPGSSVHRIFQARILVCVAVSSSRGSSQSRDQTCVSRKSPTMQVDSLLLSYQGSPPSIV